jgi:tRNA pseudouridine55 synthase
MEYVHRYPKSYRGFFLLGRQSDTDDVEGKIVEISDAPVPSREAISTACIKFTGQIMQRPPIYSAVKIEGRRSYKLARRGEAVELAEKPVTIHSLSVVDYQYPELTLDIVCSSGTYVRSLGRDLATELGTGAVMAALVRTEIGRFQLKHALQLDEVTLASVEKHLESPLKLLGGIPSLSLTEADVATLCRGMAISREALVGEIAGVDAAGNLVAILVSDGKGLLQPKRVFLPERCN